MSDQDDSEDAFTFGEMVLLSPIFIFGFTLTCSSVYVHWALWKPFWKRYTEKVEGRVRRKVETIWDPESSTGTRESKHAIKHAIIEYNVKGVSTQRTFMVGMSGWVFDGRPPIGCVSLETFDTVNSLTLRFIPGLPESAFPELELEIQQRPIPWYFYAIALFDTALASGGLGVLVPLMDEGVWKKRALVLYFVLYMTIWPIVDILVRPFAFARKKRQETTKDFSPPYNDLEFLFHDANSDDTSQLQLQSLNTAAQIV